MKATEYRGRGDLAGSSHRARDRRVAVERGVSSRLVVVRLVFAERAQEVLLAERNDVVRTFSANAADQSLDEAVLPRRLWGRTQPSTTSLRQLGDLISQASQGSRPC